MADLSPRDLRLLLALVDETLPASERPKAEARLTATPEGARALAANRRVAGALRGRGPVAPDSLRRRIEAVKAAPRRRRAWLVPAGGVAALAAAVALLLTVFVGGGPSVADAVALTGAPATEPTPPSASGRPGLLARDVEGVPFPEWGDKFGWRAPGARRDEIGGRSAVTVFYEHQGHRIGYTILSGAALDLPANARRSRVNGVELAMYRDGHRDVAVFVRGGHTCVLAGHVLHQDTLVKLATWRAEGAVSF